jgi:hypothetical protein
MGVMAFGHGHEEPAKLTETVRTLLPAQPAAAPAPAPVAPMMGSLDKSEGDHAQPFTNGAVNHGKVLKLRMDGPIDKIQGAQRETGFTVVLPGRRSLEASSAIAGKDSRIAQVRLSNDGQGTELSMNFKDGVPNYLVRAKGDVLEILLAEKKKKEHHKKTAHGAKSGKHHHD